MGPGLCIIILLFNEGQYTTNKYPHQILPVQKWQNGCWACTLWRRKTKFVYLQMPTTQVCKQNVLRLRKSSKVKIKYQYPQHYCVRMSEVETISRKLCKANGKEHQKPKVDERMKPIKKRKIWEWEWTESPRVANKAGTFQEHSQQL